MARSTQTLTWLHLSDLHACNPETGWDAARVVSALVEDLQAMRAEHGLVPDLIFFTGDAAFGHLDDGARSLPSQFEEAEQLFQKVRDLFDVPKDRFFVVPGNHDVHRRKAPKQLTHWLDTAATADEVTDLIRKGEHDWAQYMERLEDYRDFLESKGYAHLLGDPERLIYTQIQDIGGLKVGIAGFNTSWSCCRNGEKAKLWFGSQWQIPTLRNQLGEAHFRIALTHHPSNWYSEREDPATGQALARDFHVHLHGHEHQGWVQESTDGHARIAAGACYAGSKDERGYNFVRVEVEQPSGRIVRGEVWLREYDDRSARWVPGRIGGKTDKDGRWTLAGGKVQSESPSLEVPADFAPAVADVFVGRNDQLESLRSHLLAEGSNGRPMAICAVQGMPGVGKSYLADRFAFQNAKHFPGGYFRLVLDPKSPSTADALLEALADRLDVPAGADRAAAVRERLRQPRTLLHVENADSTVAGKVAAALLQDLRGCAVIVSGRLVDLGRSRGWRQVQVEPFTEEKALQQLWQELGRKPGGTEKKQHEELVQALGFLPLAIHLAAGHLRSGRTAKGFLHKLREHGLGLESADPAEFDARKVLSTSFSLSLEILSEDLGEAAERLLPGLRALGHAPLAGFGRSLGAAISGLSEEDFGDLAARAQALSLLLPISHEERPDGAWRVHPLLSELLREGANQEKPFSRMTEWFVARFPLAEPGEEADQGRRWGEIRAEGAALAAWLPRVSGDDRIGVARRATMFAYFCGPFSLWMDFCEAALRDRLEDSVRSSFLWISSLVAYQAGKLEQAHQAIEEKVRLDTSRGEEREVAFAKGWIANILDTRGQFDEALRIRQEEEIPFYEKTGDIRGRGIALIKIADVLHTRGQLDEALRILQEEVIPAFEKIGEIRERAVALGKSADILHERGQSDEAFRIRQEDELPIYEKIGDIRARAVTLGKIADILHERGQSDEALRIWQEEQIPVLDKIGDIKARAVALGRIADILRERGQLDEALRIRQKEQIPVFEKIGDIRARAVSLGKIADILQVRGQLDEALRIRQEEEIPVYEKIGDIRARLVTWVNLALIYLQRSQPGDDEQATELLHKAWRDANRLRIPEADRILGILKENNLPLPKGAA